MLNAARSPTFFEFDSHDLLRLYRELDDRGEVPVVIYHSHTATPAYPSRTDIGLASSQTPITSWCRPPSTARARARWNFARTGLLTGLSPKKKSRLSLMAVEVRIPTILRGYTDGAKTVEGGGTTLAEVIDDLGDPTRRHQGAARRVASRRRPSTVHQRLRSIKDRNDEDVRFLGGVETRGQGRRHRRRTPRCRRRLSGRIHAVRARCSTSVGNTPLVGLPGGRHLRLSPSPRGIALVVCDGLWAKHDRGGPQPHRFHQGPRRTVDARRRREAGAPTPGLHHPHAHLGPHRDLAGGWRRCAAPARGRLPDAPRERRQLLQMWGAEIVSRRPPADDEGLGGQGHRRAQIVSSSTATPPTRPSRRHRARASRRPAVDHELRRISVRRGHDGEDASSVNTSPRCGSWRPRASVRRARSTD